MRKMLGGLGRRMLALHRDDRGADMLEYILIVAAVALPLLAVVVIFWRRIADMAMNLWERIVGDVEDAI